jgi:hypothetical protein
VSETADTISSLEERDDLPWGFHDALLRAMTVDWLRQRLFIELRPKVSERQDLDRAARVVLSGLEWLVIDEKGPGATPSSTSARAAPLSSGPRTHRGRRGPKVYFPGDEIPDP